MEGDMIALMRVRLSKIPDSLQRKYHVGPTLIAEHRIGDREGIVFAGLNDRGEDVLIPMASLVGTRTAMVRISVQ